MHVKRGKYNMETFYLLLGVPVVLALIARNIFKHTISWGEMGLQMFMSCAILSIVWGLGTFRSISDTEIINGEIIKKNRSHGFYTVPYSCNCYSTCSGIGSNKTCSQHCSVCYQDHYTVNWYIETNIGDIGLDYADKLYPSVYKLPDPPQYVNAFIGEPCSKIHPYKNYIKAVPESLFNLSVDNNKFAELIPLYPKIYDHYKIQRVLSMGVPINIEKWNNLLNDKVKKLGPKKQTNIILLFVNTADQSYKYALENVWLGGKKNDIIIIIGVTQYPVIDWADIITLGKNSGNGLFSVELRDKIMDIGSIEYTSPIIDSINDIVSNRFNRKPMKDFEYLKDDIDPPDWVVAFAFILAVLMSIGLTWYFKNNDVFQL